jgi:uncharacterized membrane protein
MPSGNVLILALLLSLAANLALGGFIAGRMSAPASPPAPVAMDPYVGSLRALRDLPEHRQAAMRPLLREHLRDLRPSVRDVRRAQRRVDEALTAEPFDPAALATALERFRTALLESQERSHGALVQLTGSLNPEERLALREAMASGPRARAFYRGGEAARPPDRGR